MIILTPCFALQAGRGGVWQGGGRAPELRDGLDVRCAIVRCLSPCAPFAARTSHPRSGRLS